MRPLGTLGTRRSRRLLVLAALVLAAAIFAGTAHAGRVNQDDDRNQSYGVVYKGNPTQDCWKHHKSEGMTDSHVVIPIFPKAIKIGEPATMKVQVENSWKYDIAEIKVVLNITDAETYLVPLVGSAAESTPPFHAAWYGRLGNDVAPSTPTGVPQTLDSPWANLTFPVEPGALALNAHVDLVYPTGANAHGLTPNKVDVSFFQPGRSTPYPWAPDGSQDSTATEHDLALPRGTGISQIGVPSGQWRFQLHFSTGDADSVQYAITLQVIYASAGDKETKVFEQLRNPPDTTQKPVIIVKPRGVSDIIEIPIQGIKEGTQHVEVKVTALLYYKHQAGATTTEDWFERWATADIVVGDTFIASDVAASTGGTVEVDFYLMAGEVTGFAAAFLLLPSLLLGGTYGRASRKFLNDVLGGAKRRVMFHNLVSLGLTLVALIHIVFFLLEVRYTVMMGVLWGGLGALSLLILGLTGYYQVPLIQKYGYNWWRVLHLVFGVLVVVFVAWHSIQDGPDFFEPVKQHMPQWLQDFNWARAQDLK